MHHMAVNLDEERGGVKRAELIPCGNTTVSGNHNVCQNLGFSDSDEGKPKRRADSKMT